MDDVIQNICIFHEFQKFLWPDPCNDPCRVYLIYGPQEGASDNLFRSVHPMSSSWHNIGCTKDQLSLFALGDFHIWRPKKVWISPPVTVTNHLILFLLSAFWGPPPPNPLRTSYMEAPLCNSPNICWPHAELKDCRASSWWWFPRPHVIAQ